MIEDIVARGVHAANINLSPAQERQLSARVTSEIIANADAVRVQMEMEVWGMVR